jgi:hypothetical protein
MTDTEPNTTIADQAERPSEAHADELSDEALDRSRQAIPKTWSGGSCRRSDQP